MKKILLLVAFLFVIQFAKAQVSKGDLYLSGSLSLENNHQSSGDSYPSSEVNTFSFGISPKVGLMISSHFMAGIFISDNFYFYKTTATDSIGKSTSKTTGVSIAPGIFVRNYYPLGKGRFALFAEANASYQHYRQKTDGIKSPSRHSLNIHLLPGLSYSITRKLMVESSLGGFGFQSAGNGNTDFTFNFPQNLNLGLAFLF